MPELPEVETVRSVLEGNLIGKRIEDIEVRYAKIIHNINVSDFKKSLIGKSFKRLERYGKYLVFIFDDDTVMISHLRMEGKYFLKKSNLEYDKHEHIIFHLDGSDDLRYADVRKFGIMEIRNLSNYLTTEPLNELGKDANKISKEDISSLTKYKKPVKELLLDQTLVAGIGNIYADEILFLSKIHPETLGSSLSDTDLENIAKNAKTVLDMAILAGGTTIRTYTSSLGVTGRFQQKLNVHTQEGKECPNCKTIIIKTRVGGRGTYLCPNCQVKK